MFVMTHSWHVCHDLFSFVCHAQSFVWCHDVSFMCAMSCSYVCHNAFVRETWLNRMYDMTYSYVWNDYSYAWYHSFICLACLIHVRGVPYSNVWHTSFICVTCLIYVCDVPHSPAHLNEARDTCGWGMPHIWIRHVTHLIQAFRLFKPKHTRKETHKMGGFPLLKKERKTRIKLKNYFLTVTRLQFSGLNICIHTARFITDDWRIQEAEKTGKRYVTNRW